MPALWSPRPRRSSSSIGLESGTPSAVMPPSEACLLPRCGTRPSPSRPSLRAGRSIPRPSTSYGCGGDKAAARGLCRACQCEAAGRGLVSTVARGACAAVCVAKGRGIAAARKKAPPAEEPAGGVVVSTDHRRAGHAAAGDSPYRESFGAGVAAGERAQRTHDTSPDPQGHRPGRAQLTATGGAVTATSPRLLAHRAN